MSSRFCFLLVVALCLAAVLSACYPQALTPTVEPAATAAATAAPTAAPTMPPTVPPSPPPTAVAAVPTPAATGSVAYIEAADVSLLLAEGWVLTERTGPVLPKQDPWATAYGLCPTAEPECPGFVLVADAQSVSSQEALRRLCSGGCHGSPAPQPVVLASGAEVARYAFPNVEAGDGSTDLAHEWFVASHDGRLLVLSIIDPQTGRTHDDVLGTLAFGREPYAGPDAAGALQAARLPTPDATGGLVTGWETVEVAEVGIVAELPEGWRRADDAYVWASPTVDAMCLGIAWQERGAGREPTALLPNDAVVLGDAMVELIWGDATIYTVQVTPQDGSPASLQEHIIVLTGDRVYDLYASAPDPEAMNGLREALFHVLRSAWFRG